MDAAKALHRLAAFHEGVGVDLVCQLCLVDVDVEVDFANEKARNPKLSRCAHRTCTSCAATIRLEKDNWGIAGCPACEMDDTDCGLTRLFVKNSSGKAVGHEDVHKRFPNSVKSKAANSLLTRESLTGAEAAAVAGVLCAERRAIARAMLTHHIVLPEVSEVSTRDESDATEFWGPMPDEDGTGGAEKNSTKNQNATWLWWDCGSQLELLQKALPPSALLDDLFTSRSDTNDGTGDDSSKYDIACVSNGSALLRSGFGANIDAHGTVVRFNEYETSHEFVQDVGSKTDVHATGWLMSAGRDDPCDRLTHEELEPPRVRDSDSAWTQSTSRAEIRLVPNVEKLGRAYFVSYLRAVAHHFSVHVTTHHDHKSFKKNENAKDWWSFRESQNQPAPFVVAPSTYGKHWRHVLDSFSDAAKPGFRGKPRVTSGYAFMLLALDLAGLPEPECCLETAKTGVASTAVSGSTADGTSSTTDRTESDVLSTVGSVTLYGFEDDPRNKKDAAGGHFWDTTHKQHHSLYDLPWERNAVSNLASRRVGKILNARNVAM